MAIIDPGIQLLQPAFSKDAVDWLCGWRISPSVWRQTSRFDRCVRQWLRDQLEPDGMARDLRALNTKPWFGPRILVARAGSVFDEAGKDYRPAAVEVLGIWGFELAVRIDGKSTLR